MKICSYPRCNKDVFGGGFCKWHQWKRQKSVKKKPAVKSKTVNTRVKLRRLLINKVRIVVHRFVRRRDEFAGCISCGKKISEAGHYYASGLFSKLRYDIDNIHGQCSECNCVKAGNLVEYRKGLQERYGNEYVKRLEQKATGPQKHVWSEGELKEIYSTFKDK